MDILQFISEQGFIMIAFLYIIGGLLKRSEFIADKYIVVILPVVSCIVTPAILGGYTVDNFVQAILIAGVTVLGNQVIKQLQKAE